MPVVVYVNTYADVKAEADYCCTSGNAAAVVESLKSDTVIFLPDEFLAGNVASKRPASTSSSLPARSPASHDCRRIWTTEIIGWHGRCEVHEKFTVEDVENARQAVPRCGDPGASRSAARRSQSRPPTTPASTSAMISVRQEQISAPHYLLLTECSMGDNVAAANHGQGDAPACAACAART